MFCGNRIEFVPRDREVYTNPFLNNALRDSEGWYHFNIPLAGDATWEKNVIGYVDPILPEIEIPAAKAQLEKDILADLNRVRASMAESCIGAVNWCEAAQESARKSLDVERIRILLQQIGLAIIPFTSEHAESAAELWVPTKGSGFSLADRACLALAVEKRVPVLTADRVWSRLDLNLDIQVIR